MKIAICDDEKNICKELENIVEAYLDNSMEVTDIDVYYSAESLLKHIHMGTTYDLLFLDIEMDGLSGIEFGKLLRNDMNNEQTIIIYISWQSAYALDLFQVRPMDFIVKPFSEKRINEALDTSIKLINKRDRYFAYSYKGRTERIHIKEIQYLTSSGRKIYIHTSNGQIEFYGKLDEIINRLDHKIFWRIHKSCIINYLQSKKFEYTQVTMNDNKTLSISQKYRVNIRQMQNEVLR